MRKNFFWVFYLNFINLLFISLAQAQSINIDQSKIRLSVEPGSSKSGTIEVSNPSSNDMVVKSYLEDWVYGPAHDGTKEFYSSGTMPRSAAKWVSFVPADFIVPAFSRQSVNYTVKVPHDAEGGHYSVLFFESTIGKNPVQQGVGVNLVLRIGTIFLIETQGQTKRQAEINNFSLSGDVEKGFQIGFDLNNTGNSDITTESQFDIMDEQGVVYSRGAFNNLYTLPGDSGKLSASLKEKLPAGKYSLVMTFNLGKAQKEVDLPDGPVEVKEARIIVNDKGEITEWQEQK
jgi:hypothetical protein